MHAPKRKASPASSTALKEQRRRKAVALLKGRVTQAKVAERLGVSRAAVSQWWAAYCRHGEKGIAAKPRPGRTPKLARKALAKLPDMLERGAESYGFAGDLWTTGRVAKLINDRFGVHYDRDHVSRLLRQLGLSWQKPQKQAIERDSRAVQRWLRHEWPRIKKTPHDDEPS